MRYSLQFAKLPHVVIIPALYWIWRFVNLFRRGVGQIWSWRAVDVQVCKFINEDDSRCIIWHVDYPECSPSNYHFKNIYKDTNIPHVTIRCGQSWHENQRQKWNKIRIRAVHVAFTRKCSCQQDSASWNPPLSNAGYLYNRILHLLHVTLQCCRRSKLRKNGHWTVSSWISLFYYGSFLQDECLVHVCSVVKHKHSVPLTETETSPILKVSEDTFVSLPLKVGAHKVFQWMSIVITFPFFKYNDYLKLSWPVETWTCCK